MLLNEQTCQFRRFVRRDRSGNAKDDRFLIPSFGFWIGSHREA